jgi:serine phosphatase RsbU (regulator of sigma subunit)
VSLETKPGTVVLAYTDGLSESGNPRSEMVSERGVSSALDGLRGQELVGLVDGLLSRNAEFRGASAQEDDVTLMTARFEPAARSA